MWHYHAMKGVESTLFDLLSGKPPTSTPQQAHVEDMCLDCCLKSPQKKSKLTKLFQNLVKPGYEQCQVLVTSQLSSMLFHPEINERMYNLSKKVFEKLIVYECEALPTIVKLLYLKPEKPEPDSPCVCYYCISILGALCSGTALERMASGGKSSRTKYAIEIIKAGAIAPLVELAGGSRSFIEQIKAAWALREICEAYTEAGKLIYECKGIPIMFDLYNNARKIIDDAYKEGFQEYQCVLLSMGVGSMQSVNPMTITKEEAYKRALTRIHALQENTASLIAHMARWSDDARQEIVDRGIADFTLSFLSKPIITEIDEDCFTSWCYLIEAMCRNEKFSNIMIDKGLVPLLEKIIYVPSFLAATQLVIAVKNLLKHSHKAREQIVAKKRILNFIIDHMHARVSLIQNSCIETVLEIAKHKETCESLLHIQPDSFAELMLEYTKEIAEITINTIKEIRKHYPQHLSNFVESHPLKFVRKKHLKQSTNYKEQGNNAFREKNFEKAIELYNKGIMSMPYFTGESPLPILYSNRAECELQLKHYSKAIRSCTLSLAGDSDNIKSLYRRGRAFAGLKKTLEAMNDFYACLRENPGDKTIQQQLKKLEIHKACAYCGAKDKKLLLCTRCKQARYCDRECQRKHWSVHKQTCKSQQ